MKTKLFLTLLSLTFVFIIGIIIQSCGNEEETAKFNCEKLCSKEKECDPENYPDTCIKNCEDLNSKEWFQSSYVKSANSCFDKSCSEYNNCLKEATKDCKEADTSSFYNAICDKAIKCGSNISKQECVDQMKKDLSTDDELSKCFSEKFYKDAEDCINKAQCSNLEKDIATCMGGDIK